MAQRLQAFGLVVAMWAVAVAFGTTSSAQQLAAGEKKVWDGVYTAAQAARGKPRFEASCSRCHNLALIGSERGPALKGSSFWSKWENENLGSLYTLMRDTMPRDGGASVVSDEVKTDILAYILSVSGMPPGNDELKVDLRALEGVKIAKKTVWDGVFTAAQAERGKENYLTGRCGGCHKLDLTGDRGPALKGGDFIAHWDNGSVITLFDKIRETMPQNSPNDVTEDAKADIVAYLLQQNGFPPGKTELRAEAESLGIIDIVRKGQSNTIANFSLVQVVGCLTQTSANAWTLTKTSEPVPIREEEPNAAALRAAQGKALGSQTFQLVSVVPFKPDGHKGQKVEARGLLYRDQNDALLNLTSLQMVSASCGS
jgi:mono/diheme cytochrome c family protein